MYIVYYNKRQSTVTIHYTDCGLTSRRRSNGPFLTEESRLRLFTEGFSFSDTWSDNLHTS